MPTSRKWISSDEGDISVHDVREVFQPVLRNHCNLISIFGRARQGKSFLMNCLSGEQELFKISNLKDSCTQGIDISDKWLNLKDFATIDNTKGKLSSQVSNSKVKIGFVDAEGQGDKDVSYDANLICPVLLASRCVIFNWKGDLQKDHILSTLGIMTRAAKNVKSDDAKTSTSASTSAKKFGHLHIVFRDWQAVDSDSNSVFATLFGPERSKESATRDQIRSEVQSAFESITVWLFDAPVESVKALRTKLSFEITSTTFREHIRLFRNTLSIQLSNPTEFAGHALTGKSLVPVVARIVDTLNRGETVLPSSTYLGMMREELDKVATDYDTKLQQFVSKLLQQYERDVEHAATVAPSTGKSNWIHFPSEQAALQTLATLTKDLNASTEQFLAESMGQLPYRDRLSRTWEAAEQQFMAKREVLWQRWLTTARQHAERVLDLAKTNLEAALPLDAAELDNQVQKCLRMAVGFLYDHSDAESDIKDSTEVVDATQLLKRYCDEHLQRPLQQQNQQFLQQQQQELLDMVDNEVDDLQRCIRLAQQQLDQQHPNGFSLRPLVEQLNKRYAQVEQHLKSDYQQSSHLPAAVDQLFDRCKQLDAELNKNYNALRKQRMAVIEADAEANVQRVVQATGAEWVQRARNGGVTVEEIEWQFEALLDCAVKETLQRLQGWLQHDEEVHEEVAKRLSEVYGEVVGVVLDDVTAQVQEILQQLEQQQQANEAEMADVEDEEEEEAEEEDVAVRAPSNVAGTSAGKLSAKEQKERARQWAAAQFGAGATANRKRKGSSAAPANKKISTTSAGAAVGKSVEQQRKDAMDFARSKFGLQHFDDSPPAKSRASKTTTNNNSTNSNSSRTSSGAVRGVFSAATRASSTAPESEPDNHAASMTATSSNSKAKSRKSLSQSAAEEARMAEQARLDSYMASKSSASTGKRGSRKA